MKKLDGEEKVLTSDKPISNGTIRRELSVLSAALHHAVNNGRLTLAPKIEMPSPSPNKTRYLERDEIERLLTACAAPHLKFFVTLAINTGARKGALLDMRWQQIDFANRLIYLNPEGREQTTKRRAIVPINDFLYQVLIDERAEIKKRIEARAAANKPPLPPCDYVISYRNAPAADIKGSFRNSCKRAGLENVTPHTLRHTAGTLMALAGIDLFIIAKVLGHSIQKTTELYAHFQPSYLRGAVGALGNAMPSALSRKTPPALPPPSAISA
jgi:integrase